MKLATHKKSEDWDQTDLEKVLKSLWNGKSRDFHGHIYEIFKYSGSSLKNSLLRMANFIKLKQRYPVIFFPATITSIYKSKGDRLDPANYRGIFNLIKARMINDRPIYNDNYDVIDSGMSAQI